MDHNNECPDCGHPLPLDAINLLEGVAWCRQCGLLSRLSDVAHRWRPTAEVLSQPPSGCAIEAAGREIVVETSLRSLSGFLGTLFICLFWNGIVSVFVLTAIEGLHRHLIGPMPVWFPAPNRDGGESLGEMLFLCLFLIPFVTIGAALTGAVALSAFGKIRVTISETVAVVQTGVGWLAWLQRFDPTLVRKVAMGCTNWEQNGQKQQVIEITANRTIKFGSLLPQERRDWLEVVLRELLTKTRDKWCPELFAGTATRQE